MLELEVVLVGAEDGVPEAEEGGVVADVVAVVEVVVFGASAHWQQAEYAPAPFVPAVPVSGFPDSNENPHEDGGHMDRVDHAQQPESKPSGYQVGHHKLYRMRIFRSQRNRNLVLVVLLVNPIEWFGV